MRRTRALALLVALAVLGVTRLPAQTGARPSRTTVIISDLHLGPGRDATSGAWSPFEDFRWEEDLAAFLAEVTRAGDGAVDLVLNGDTFDLLQSPTQDCRHDAERFGCTEAEALARLDRVVVAHAPVILALRAFARDGTNRLVLVPGDHDAALLFSTVGARAVRALNAPGRVSVASRGAWTSDDGAIHAEHGHQIGDDPHAYATWPDPFVTDAAGQRYLERTWGEQLLQPLWSRIEPSYPTVDNFAQVNAGVRALLAADPDAVAPAGAGPWLALALRQPGWQQFRLDLDTGDVQPPDWDLDAVRRDGLEFLVESLPGDDPIRLLAERATREGTLSLPPEIGEPMFSDAALTAVCDYRAAIRRSRRRFERSLTQLPSVGPALRECLRQPDSRGSAFEDFWRSRDLPYRDRPDATDSAEPPDPVKVFVRGHTHLPSIGFVANRDAPWPIVLDAGAWIRTITPFQLQALAESSGRSVRDLLAELRPEQLPACYGAVWIPPYADAPEPEVRIWRGDRWGRLPRDAAPIETACGGGGP